MRQTGLAGSQSVHSHYSITNPSNRSTLQKIPYDAGDGWYCGVKPDLTHTYKTDACGISTGAPTTHALTTTTTSTAITRPKSPVCSRTSEQKPFTVTAKFDKADDFEGWNCGQIKACGTYGNLCGGQAVKGKGDDITKTFDVPSGTYLVTLDFIAIDSWFVRSRKCAVVVFSL